MKVRKYLLGSSVVYYSHSYIIMQILVNQSYHHLQLILQLMHHRIPHNLYLPYLLHPLRHHRHDLAQLFFLVKDIEEAGGFPGVVEEARGVARSGRTATRGRSIRGSMTTSVMHTSTRECAGDEWRWSSSNGSSTATAIPFTGNTPGPFGIATGSTDPLKCFYLFIPPSFFADLLVQTNLYADQ